MKNTIRIAILTLLISFTTGSWGQNIVYPWRATTAILKSGENFEVWFNALPGQTVNSVELIGTYNMVNTSINTINGDWTYDPMSGNKYNTKITVTVPANTPANRYDLVLKTSSGDVTSYGGVKIVKEYKSDYYLMHISDGHIFQNGYDSDAIQQRKSAMLDMANIMDVQVLIETGDNMYNVRNHPEREAYYFLGNSTINTLGVSQISAATFITPGDHEGLNANDFAQGTAQENADFVNDYWGLQSHSFKYGNARFMNINNAWALSATNNNAHQYQVDEAINWLNGPGSGGNFFLTAGHVYDKMHSFINANTKLSLVLAGDKHHVYTTNPFSFTTGSPTIAFIAGSMREHFTFNLFRINNATGAYTTPAGSAGFANALFSGDLGVPSTWVPNLKMTYSTANNGSIDTNIATIENKFSFPILGARVRFVVPKGQTYAATNGTIDQEFDGTQFHIIDVLTDVAANSNAQVYIAPGMGVDLCPLDPNKTAPGICGCGVPEGTCTINVSSFSIAPTSAKMFLKVTKQITPTILPDTATDKSILWSTSDANVATVDTNGLVTAVGAGNAIITATTTNGGFTATSNITVIAETSVFQAEDAELRGVLVVANQPDYRGTGFADYTNTTNDFIKWTIYSSTTENYNLTFRYASSTVRPLKLTINGVDVIPSLAFPATGSFAVWGTHTVSQLLNTGNNVITLTAIGSSGGNFDELTVTKTLGITEIEKNQTKKTLKIFPNPLTNNILSVGSDGFDDDTNVRIIITNASGQKLYEKTVRDPCGNDIDLKEKLVDGVYFITLESDQAKITKKLIVKQ